MSDKSWEPGMFCKTCKLANLQIDPWDTLNKFSFHAQKSLFIVDKCNGFSGTSTSSSSPSPVSFEFIELVPS